MDRYFLAVALAVATALSLSAQVGIGTKNPEGVLDVVARAKGKDDKTVEAALVLPRVSSVSKVVNLQEGKDKPAEGSLVFDQSKQCLRYYYLKDKNNPQTGGWSPCIASSNDHSPEPDPTPDPGPTDPLAPVTFRTCGKDLTYGKVQSPKTNRIWLDRNLGATKVATVPMVKEDTLAIGYLYQWGRESDGHECVDWSSNPPKRSENTTKQSDKDQVGHNKFIAVDSRPYDWRTPENLNLWQKDSKTGVIINNPCPAGFRVPTKEEFEAESLALMSDPGHFLKLYRYALSRTHSDNTITSGSESMYWTASPKPSESSHREAYILENVNTSQVINIYAMVRAYGNAIRCINDQ